MMTRSKLDAINLDSYGLKHAEYLGALIDQIFTSTEPADLKKSIALINEIPQDDLRDRAMGGLIRYASTGDRDAAAKSIKGYEYLAAHLFLGKHMHALQVRYDHAGDNPPPPPPPSINAMPTYPTPDRNYQPASTSITEILCETVQASNAPSAAKERSSLQSLSS